MFFNALLAQVKSGVWEVNCASNFSAGINLEESVGAQSVTPTKPVNDALLFADYLANFKIWENGPKLK